MSRGSSAFANAISIASVPPVGGGAEVSDNLRPSFAHVLESSCVLRQDEAGMDKAKTRAVFNPGKDPRDDSIQPRSVADVSLVPTFPGIDEAFVRHDLKHLAV